MSDLHNTHHDLLAKRLNLVAKPIGTVTNVRLVRLSMDGFTAREIEKLLLDEAAARRRRDGVDDWHNDHVLSLSNGGGGGSEAAAKNKTPVAATFERL
jgi:hypothetical protein